MIDATTSHRQLLEGTIAEIESEIILLRYQIKLREMWLQRLQYACKRSCAERRQFCEDCGQLIHSLSLGIFSDVTRCSDCARARRRMLYPQRAPRSESSSHSPPFKLH